MYFTSSIGDAIRIPLRLTLSLLSCFSLGVVQLIGAAPMTKPSITAEQYLRLHLQTPKIFFRSSDSQISRSILTGQTNHAEIGMASPKMLYTCCISFLLYMLYILSTEHSSNGKYDYFILLYDKQWGTRQLSYPWWTLLNTIIIYLYVFELCICQWAWELS